MNFIRIPAALALCSFAACSTTYTPQSNGRMRLGVDKGVFVLTKDGRTFPIDAPLTRDVTEDREVLGFAAKAQFHYEQGQVWSAAASLVQLLFGPGTLSAVVLSSVAEEHYEKSAASVVDTINVHNDLIYTEAAEVAVQTQPEATP